MEPPSSAAVPKYPADNGVSHLHGNIVLSGGGRFSRLAEEEVAAHPEMRKARLLVSVALASGLSEAAPVISDEAQRLRVLGFQPGDIAANLVEPANARGFSMLNGLSAVETAIGFGLKAELPVTIARPFVDRNPTETRQPVSAINIADFLRRTFLPRETMLSPWLPEQGLALLHAPRGVGKTHFAHGVGVAIATASAFLRSKALRPRKLLLLDGEMPAVALQQRLNSTVKISGANVTDPNFLRIAAADSLPDGLPDLSDPKNHQLYANVVADADFVIVDNLSTICPGLKENDADSWTPVQAWALSLRRAGKSVLFVHHDGKSGAQRGTSRKEDVLDTVISLRRPPDHTPEHGARFEVHFEKYRGFYGPDAETFEAKLVGDCWELGTIKAGDDNETLIAMHGSGMSLREMERRTGLSKSAIQRRLKECPAGQS